MLGQGALSNMQVPRGSREKGTLYELGRHAEFHEMMESLSVLCHVLPGGEEGPYMGA